jgi:dipeptidase
MIGALADAHYAACIQHIDRYQEAMEFRGRQLIREYDRKIAETGDLRLAEEANGKLCEMAKEETGKALNNVLQTASEGMKNGYRLADN